MPDDVGKQAPTPGPRIVPPVSQGAGITGQQGIGAGVAIGVSKPPGVLTKAVEPPNTIPAQDASVAVKDPPGTPAAPPPTFAPGMTREQKLTQLCVQRFLRIQELPDANFSHRGYCAKCGWQSYQHSVEAATELVTKHVLAHWKDVAAAA